MEKFCKSLRGHTKRPLILKRKQIIWKWKLRCICKEKFNDNKG